MSEKLRPPEQVFLPPTAEKPRRPAVVLEVPYVRDTKNYRRFETEFSREVVKTNGGFHVSISDFHHLGNPSKVRVILEAVED